MTMNLICSSHFDLVQGTVAVLGVPEVVVEVGVVVIVVVVELAALGERRVLRSLLMNLTKSWKTIMLRPCKVKILSGKQD